MVKYKPKEYRLLIRFLKESGVYLRFKPYIEQIETVHRFNEAFDAALGWYAQPERFDFWYYKQLDLAKLFVIADIKNKKYIEYYKSLIIGYDKGTKTTKFYKEHREFYAKTFGFN